MISHVMNIFTYNGDAALRVHTHDASIRKSDIQVERTSERARALNLHFVAGDRDANMTASFLRFCSLFKFALRNVVAR